MLFRLDIRECILKAFILFNVIVISGQPHELVNCYQQQIINK